MDPVLVPPLHRIHLHAVHLHAEVQVIAARESRSPLCRSAAPSSPCRPASPRSAQVAVDRLQPVAVIDHDAVAVDPESAA